jgi:hypothetical protein
MATINTVVSRAWTFVGDSVTGFKLTNRSVDLAEYAITEAGAPTVAWGHPLGGGESTDVTPGRLYVRVGREMLKTHTLMAVATALPAAPAAPG